MTAATDAFGTSAAPVDGGGAPGGAAPAAVSAIAAPITAPAAGQQAAPQEWYSSIADENIRTWTQGKGWKDGAAAAESAFNLEKLIGHDKAGRTIVMPKPDSSPEEVKAFRTKMGVPETAEGYKFSMPDGMDPAFSKTAAGWFHELGIPAKEAETLVKNWNDHQVGQLQAHNERIAQQSQTAFDQVKAEWGKEADQRIELSRRATAQFIPAKDAQERQSILSAMENSMGTAMFMKVWSKIGEGMGEHAVHQSKDAPGMGGLMSSGQAKAEIQRLKEDADWTKGYMNGDSTKVEQMTRLNKIAYPS